MKTPRDLATPLSRITWRDGQTLTSRDLGDDQNYIDRLRYLHIRYQHKTWGVVEGLRVVALKKVSVFVTAGYALDIHGRELLLPEITLVPLPSNLAASTTMYLVISRGAALSGLATPDLATLCPGVRSSAPIEQGQLSWKTLSEVRLGDDVLLGRALIAPGGKLDSVIDVSIQRFATGMNQPQLWSDETQPGSTGWIDGQGANSGYIYANVDTSDAGFTATAAYFAQFAGSSVPGLGHIVSAGATDFTFVLFPDAAGGARTTAATAEKAGWIISWLAVEVPSQRLLLEFSELKEA